MLYPKKENGADSSSQDNSHSYSAQMTGKMESFLASMRHLEDALNHEKRKTRKVSEDYANAHATYERVVRELQTRVRELEIQERKLKESVDENKNHQEKILHKLREINTEEKKAKAELQHYKAAWADVLVRDKEAKALVQDHQAIRLKLQEMERSHQSMQQSLMAEKSKYEQVDRHSKSYQRELQNALIRIHSSEAKFNELSKEFQTLSQIKRNADEEIAKLENSMRERFKWELATEREKLRAELEKDAALDRERFRELSRHSMQAEIQKSIDSERKRYQADQEKFILETAALGEALDLSQAESRQLKGAGEETSAIIEGVKKSLMEAQQSFEATLLQTSAALNHEKQRFIKMEESLRQEITLLKRTIDSQNEQSEDLVLKLRAYQNQVEQLNQQNLLFQSAEQQKVAEKTEQLAHQAEKLTFLQAQRDEQLSQLESQHEKRTFALKAELERERLRANRLQESLLAEKIQAKEQIEVLKEEASLELNQAKAEAVAAAQAAQTLKSKIMDAQAPSVLVDTMSEVVPATSDEWVVEGIEVTCEEGFELSDIIEDESLIHYVMAGPADPMSN
ncbi:MAG: hypothetical protein H7222_09125 [Methylotenera sp.]|nr:hypothetical protein [Oligoflexia bacterium]